MRFDENLLIRVNQEFDGIFDGMYDFTGRIVMGREFYDYYGSLAEQIARAAVEKVKKEVEHPDYIQIFCYEGCEEWKGKKFYVISGFLKGTKPSDYVGSEDEFYVSVVLPSER